MAEAGLADGFEMELMPTSTYQDTVRQAQVLASAVGGGWHSDNHVTIIGLQITALFSGIVIVEVVFSWPGLGKLAFNAVEERDYPLLQGAVMVIAIMVTLVNLMVDLLYFLLDPRIKYV